MKKKITKEEEIWAKLANFEKFRFSKNNFTSNQFKVKKFHMKKLYLNSEKTFVANFGIFYFKGW